MNKNAQKVAMNNYRSHVAKIPSRVAEIEQRHGHVYKTNFAEMIDIERIVTDMATLKRILDSNPRGVEFDVVLINRDLTIGWDS